MPKDTYCEEIVTLLHVCIKFFPYLCKRDVKGVEKREI